MRLGLTGWPKSVKSIETIIRKGKIMNRSFLLAALLALGLTACGEKPAPAPAPKTAAPAPAATPAPAPAPAPDAAKSDTTPADPSKGMAAPAGPTDEKKDPKAPG